MTSFIQWPWRAIKCVGDGPYGPAWSINLDEKTPIASVSGMALHCGAEKAARHAHLLAAAPEMLAALLLAREYLKHSLGSTSEINPYPAIEHAIAKGQAAGLLEAP